ARCPKQPQAVVPRLCAGRRYAMLSAATPATTAAASRCGKRAERGRRCCQAGEGEMVTNWVPRRGPDRETERRTRQIKEIVRLGLALRADLPLNVILRQVVEAINSTLGFRVAVLNLLHADREHVEIVATAGLTEVERERLTKSPPLVSRLLGVLRPEFCISH